MRKLSAGSGAAACFDTTAVPHGGASLLDYLNAQNEYRSVQLNYLNLVAAYLNAASQLNFALGREVLQ